MLVSTYNLDKFDPYKIKGVGKLIFFYYQGLLPILKRELNFFQKKIKYLT